RLLRCNLVANELDDRVHTVRAAASMNSGTGQLVRSSSNSGDHRVRLTSRGDHSHADDGTIEVPLRRLDDLLAEHHIEIGDIGAVWIDSQGHEAHVLGGAPDLMRSSVPVIVEYWPYGLRLADGLDLLHSLIAENFDLVIDVRDADRDGKARSFPARDVGQLEQRYTDDSFTELILLTDH
ncbi:MAG: FkbM family methyltransferase, partial [Actinomycetota bacterium]|nr:FkbM family methyltransferase [Actinomycetota bacterium]